MKDRKKNPEDRTAGVSETSTLFASGKTKMGNEGLIWGYVPITRAKSDMMTRKA